MAYWRTGVLVMVKLRRRESPSNKRLFQRTDQCLCREESYNMQLQEHGVSGLLLLAIQPPLNRSDSLVHIANNKSESL